MYQKTETPKPQNAGLSGRGAFHTSERGARRVSPSPIWLSQLWGFGTEGSQPQLTEDLRQEWSTGNLSPWAFRATGIVTGNSFWAVSSHGAGSTHGGSHWDKLCSPANSGAVAESDTQAAVLKAAT